MENVEEVVIDELQEQKNKYLLLAADFDNYKKRTAKEYNDLQKSAGKDILFSLLDILDDCDRAEKSLETNGVSIIFNKLRTTLNSKGLKPFDSIGAPFDVDKHEAISELNAGSEMRGKVIDEVMKGYYLNDKIIRYAKVVVGV
jgi:molecular chaperone GrpE